MFHHSLSPSTLYNNHAVLFHRFIFSISGNQAKRNADNNLKQCCNLEMSYCRFHVQVSNGSVLFFKIVHACVNVLCRSRESARGCDYRYMHGFVYKQAGAPLALAP